MRNGRQAVLVRKRQIRKRIGATEGSRE